MAENKKLSPTTQKLEEKLNGWRWVIKEKQRGIFSFEDLAAIKLADLKIKIYPSVHEIPAWQIKECIHRGIGKYEFIDAEWREIDVGDNWGGEGRSAFFRNKIEIPAEMKGMPVALMLYLEGDSLLSLNGVPYHGLDPFRNSVLLTECAKGGETYDIDVESYYKWHEGESAVKTIDCSCLAAIDREIESAYWDYRAVFGALAMPNADESFLGAIKNALKEAITYIDFDEKDSAVFKGKLLAGQKVLQEKVFKNPNFHVEGTLNLIGHSHLDLVFLWDYKEFVRKAGRTHATMLRLLEQYPDFIFSQSQPVMYEELRLHYPALFEQIRRQVKAGRWEPVGAMWCEPDCNLISGESFVRQILFGTLYYEKWFNVTPHTCFLPDVFGNSYGMPQILAKSSIEYFVTHKMNIWNDTNPWQYSAFWWDGPDGSRVFGVVPPTHFMGTMEADSLRAHWNKFSEKTTVGESLYLYGWGDGGGGVDPEMLEFMKRYRHFPGLPATEPIKVEDALKRMKDKAENLTVWKDELYLEAHRGVGTTKGLLKKNNRRAENLYRAVELFGVAAEQLGGGYPAENLREGWQKILTAQFHDSLPGSHITSVYGDLLKEYDDIFKLGGDALESVLGTVTALIPRDESQGQPFAVINPLGSESTSAAFIPNGNYEVYSSGGVKVPSQPVQRPDGAFGTEFIAESVPAAGYRVYYAKPSSSGLSVSRPQNGVVAENKFFRVAFDKRAEITSIYDKRADREVLAAGARGNRLRMFEDRPGKYEAWDIVATYVNNEIDLADGRIESVEEGEIGVAVNISKPLLESLLRQRVVIYKDLDRIDFETWVDWKERRKLLKAEFHVDIASRAYTSDIAYATIERSNCRYNSYDKAKFEATAHNFIDLSDDDYGVSLLNDCKYGHEVDGSRMMITLLKGPMNPDPQSDIGVSTFTYCVYPHAEDWRRAETLQRGLEINNPFIVRRLEGTWAKAGAPDSLISVSAKNVTLEAFKRCESGDGYLVRICEKTGRATPVDIKFFKSLKKAQSCNMIERDASAFPSDGRYLRTKLKPYEVQSFIVHF
ncbi:MAG: glycosyl hydrolase-related protein [Clostridiales bacterium]|jgi:alpha-mannosidase|nr:glycosyl hydrolase-related protein [Clostridiales bacterium]